MSWKKKLEESVKMFSFQNKTKRKEGWKLLNQVKAH